MSLSHMLMLTFEILQFVKGADCYPNVNCFSNSLNYAGDCGIKKFLDVKLLKNDLRSSMSQERLNDLVILCIEINMIEHTIDVDTIISDFTSKNTVLNIWILNNIFFCIKSYVFIRLFRNVIKLSFSNKLFSEIRNSSFLYAY